jgi:hypothetical protein
MAQKTTVFTLKVDGTEQAVNSVNDLKKAIGKLEEELESAELGSQKFKQLQAELVKAKSKFKDLDEATEGRNLEERVGSFAKIGEAIAGSFAVASGAAAMFGAENEDLAKAELKVQAALTIAMGARSVAEGVMQAGLAKRIVLEKAAAAGTFVLNVVNKALNTTLKANPIFLIVTVLTLAVAGFLKLADTIKGATGTFSFLGAALEKVTGFLRDVGNFVFPNLIDDATTAKTIENADKILKKMNEFGSQEQARVRNAQRQLAYAEAVGASDDKILEKKKAVAAAEQELNSKKINYLIAAGKNRTTEEKEELAKLQVANIDSQQNITNAIVANNKKRTDKITENNKAAVEQMKEYNSKIRSLQQQAALAAISDETKKAEKQAQFDRSNAIKEIQQSKFTAEQKNKLIAETNVTWDALDKARRAQNAKDEQEKAKSLAQSLNAIRYEINLMQIKDQGQRQYEALKQEEQTALDSVTIEEAAAGKKADIRKLYALKTKELSKQLAIDEFNQQQDLAQQDRNIKMGMLDANMALLSQSNVDKFKLELDYFNKKRELERADLVANQEAELKRMEMSGATIEELAKKKQQFGKAEIIFDKQTAAAKTQIDKGQADAKLSIISGALTGIMSLVGQNTAEGKALGIAQAVIDTYVGANKAFAQGGTFGFIGAAGIIAAGLANVATIMSTPIPGAENTNTVAGPSKFAKGGVLRGPSHAQGGIKTSFGELEGGEWVINRNSSAQFHGLLSAINTVGGGRKYADGGMLGVKEQMQSLQDQLSGPQVIKTYVVQSDISDAQRAQSQINRIARL